MKLELGYKHDFEVRYERYDHEDAAGLSVLYLSDLHFNSYSRRMLHNIQQTITTIDPTVIILGGDYVDTAKGFLYFKALLKFLSYRTHVIAIPGNHDYFFGIQKIRAAVKESGCIWLEKETITCVIATSTVQFSNAPDVYDETAHLRILCLHQPIHMTAVTSKYHLIFAGHLHGGQFVFWETSKGLYPARIFYRWNILKKHLGNSVYLISKGLGDTLPIRYNCRKDMICVQFSTPQTTLVEKDKS